MPSNFLLHFITKVIKIEDFQATNYHFFTENELLDVVNTGTRNRMSPAEIEFSLEEPNTLGSVAESHR